MKIKKMLSVIISIAVILSMTSIAVLALEQGVHSDFEKFTGDDKKYEACNYLFLTPYSNNTTTVQGSVQVNALSYKGEDCPAGLMGAKPNVYNDNGTLFSSGSWSYNNGDGNALGADLLKDINGGEGKSFYSKGSVAIWNGDDYDRTVLGRTPSLTNTYDEKHLYKIGEIYTNITGDYGVNKNNQTYGSSLFANTIAEEPELISAMGIGGIEGYVYRDELNNIGWRDNPNVVVPISNGPTAIPLFAVDGTTVIGEFLVEETQAINYNF